MRCVNLQGTCKQILYRCFNEGLYVLQFECSYHFYL